MTIWSPAESAILDLMRSTAFRGWTNNGSFRSFCNSMPQAIDRIVAIVHRYPILVKGNLWLVAVILNVFFNFIIFRFKRSVLKV